MGLLIVIVASLAIGFFYTQHETPTGEMTKEALQKHPLMTAKFAEEAFQSIVP